jgi:hypothetical protein
MRREGPYTSDSRKRQLGGTMWWGIGFGGLLYLVLLITLGVMTLRNGHGWMFFFGIFLPIFWIIGAIMRPTPARAA